MDWRIEFDADAFEELSRLDKSVQRRILRYLRERIGTAEDPRRFGKPLKGELCNLWRYRVNDFRLVCDIREDRRVVLVLRVGHRKNIYD